MANLANKDNLRRGTQLHQAETLAEQMAKVAQSAEIQPKKSLNDGMYSAFGGQNPQPTTQPK